MEPNMKQTTMRKAGQLLAAVLIVLSALSLSAVANDSKKKKKDQAPTGERTVETATAAVKPVPTPTPANGSLFTDEAPATSLVSDFKPRRVGDLVFVDVVEVSTATVSSSASRSRDSGTIGGLGGAISAIPNPAAATVSGVVVGLGQRKYDGKGATERQSKLSSRIVARVVEVLPNGDLRIAATKMVKINKEDESLSLSGLVRQRDVSPANAVPTTAVGELKVALNGKGVASADNAPGWLFRLFDKISPF